VRNTSGLVLGPDRSHRRERGCSQINRGEINRASYLEVPGLGAVTGVGVAVTTGKGCVPARCTGGACATEGVGDASIVVSSEMAGDGTGDEATLGEVDGGATGSSNSGG
jgi:hypothetical protein